MKDEKKSVGPVAASIISVIKPDVKPLSTLPPNSLKPMRSMVKIKSFRPDISPVVASKIVTEQKQ